MNNFNSSVCLFVFLKLSAMITYFMTRRWKSLFSKRNVEIKLFSLLKSSSNHSANIYHIHAMFHVLRMKITYQVGLHGCCLQRTSNPVKKWQTAYILSMQIICTKCVFSVSCVLGSLLIIFSFIWNTVLCG